MTEMTRRDALHSAVSTGAVGLAGCITPGGNTGANDGNTSGDSDGSEDDSPGDDGDMADTAIVGTTITTKRTDCGSEDDETVGAATEGNTVTIVGVTPAPTPCHEAVLSAAAVADGELSVTVGVQKTDEQACIDCIGQIEYGLRVELDDVDIERVTVDHEEGEQRTIEREAFTDDFPEPAVRSATIETTETSCDSGESDHATIEREGDAVVVTGALPANNPCHVAVLGDVSISNEQLTVPVGVESDGTDVCIECTGTVAYTARIELEDSEGLASVRVNHDGGGSFGVGWDERTTS